MTLLNVQDLSVEYETTEATIRAVNGVSFSIEEDEKFGLVGESGCGKSTVAKAILRLLPDNGRIADGSITLSLDDEHLDLVTATGRQLREIRWEELSTVSQSAMNALDPVYTIGEQIVEAIKLHTDGSGKKPRERAKELLDLVGLDVKRVDSYPHQLSGGMRQRAMIAMSLALDPALVIADEPTTALDVITQDHILEEINELTDSLGSSLLIITHDISVVAETCDRVGVMYGGELVEVGPTEEVFVDPEHPYTQGLMNAFPSIEGEKSELITMPGEPPDLSERPPGCIFAERCPYREDRCTQEMPALTERGPDHEAACYVTDDGLDMDEHLERILMEGSTWQRL
jgi:oligopeptide/dipeptide ABC transporter ATP-binding protein